MLDKKVVEAAEKGQFFVYPIETIDDAISLLTGIEAGEKDAAGNYPQGSINQRINSRLDELEAIRQKYADVDKEKK